jgi:hypothetical protein
LELGATPGGSGRLRAEVDVPPGGTGRRAELADGGSVAARTEGEKMADAD